MTGRNYQSWDFQDRSFLWAVAISILWHCFWFFSVTIVVSPPRKHEKTKPRMVSLGPVLDDRILKTLVEAKPQLSQTFYRQLSDFSPALDLKVKTVERQAPGGVVSLPAGKKFIDSLKELVGGVKSSPDVEFSATMPQPYAALPFAVEGEIKSRQILNIPEEPSFPPDADPALKRSRTEIEFTVEPSGSVDLAQVLTSSGDPALDRVWVKYLRGWQFAPLASATGLDQKGRVSFYFRQENSP